MKQKVSSSSGASGAVYGLGIIGAPIYYILTATSFWIGVLGVLKAIVLPAILVFEALKYFQAKKRQCLATLPLR